MALHENLSAFFPMTESSGTRAAKVGGLSATATGTVNAEFGWVLAQVPQKAVLFSGSNNLSVSHASAVSPAGVFTVSFWFCLGDKTQDRTLFEKGGHYAFYYDQSADRFVFSVADGSDTQTLAADTFGSPEALVWYHGECTYDGMDITVRINGTADTATATLAPGGTSNTLYFGRNTAGTSANWLGCLQEWGLWTRAWTSAERTQHYNQGIGLAFPFVRNPLADNRVSILRLDALNRGSTSSDPSPNANGWEQFITSRTIGGTTYQVLAYWNVNENLVIGVRTLPSGEWTWYVYDGTGGLADIALAATYDGHETIGVAIDSGGLLHIAYDHHNTALNYRRSDAALSSWTGGLTTAQAFTGVNESQVSYVNFFFDAADTLGVIHRNGTSGDGNWYWKTWNGSAWADHADAGTEGLIWDGATDDVNAYPFGAPKLDSAGRLHFGWAWRLTTDTATDQDIHHCTWRSDEGFRDLAGNAVTIPAAIDSTDTLVVEFDPADGIEQLDMCLDDDDHPHLLSYNQAEGGGNTFIYQFYYDGAAWQSEQIWDRSRTNSDYMSRPRCMWLGQFVVIYADLMVADGTLRAMWKESGTTHSECLLPIGVGLQSGGSIGYPVSNAIQHMDQARFAREGSLDQPLFVFAGQYGNRCPLLMLHDPDPTEWIDGEDLSAWDGYDTLPIPAASVTTAGGAVASGGIVSVDLSLLSADWWAAVDESGVDVRFADSSGNQLAGFVAEIDSAGETGHAFVGVGALSAGDDQAIRVYAGNSSARTVTPGSKFQRPLGRRMHWSLESPIGSADQMGISDTTVQGTAGVVSGSAAQGAAFDTINAAYLQGTNAHQGFGVKAFPVTMGGWIKLDSVATEQVLLQLVNPNLATTYISLAAVPTRGWEFQVRNAGASIENTNFAAPAGGTIDTDLHLLIGVCESSTSHKVYLDGALVDASTVSSGFSTVMTRVALGKSTDSTPAFQLDGHIDDAFIDAASRDAAWVGNYSASSITPDTYFGDPTWVSQGGGGGSSRRAMSGLSGMSGILMS